MKRWESEGRPMSTAAGLTYGETGASSPQGRRRRRVKAVVALLIGTAVLIAGFAVYLATAADRRYRAALAETDRLDPGWRFSEIEAARSVVPDAENSALRLIAAGGFCTRKLQAAMNAVPNLASQRAVNEPYGPGELAAIRAAVLEGAPALAEARLVAGMPRGRHPVALTKDVVMTSWRHLGVAKMLGRLLRFDVRARMADGDFEGAAASALAILNAARAIGDEPFGPSQLARGRLLFYAFLAVEDVLTGGELSESTLAALQAGLEADADGPPMLLTALRGDRAQAALFFDAAANGDADYLVLVTDAPKFWGRFLFRGPPMRLAEAWALTRSNEVVEAAREPRSVEFYRDWQARLDADVGRMGSLERARAKAATFFPPVGDLAEDLFHMQALRDAAIVLIAAERFRMAVGRWPETYDELRPKYLKHVPLDPFGDGPLRLKRFEDGLAVYSVGANHVDDGGTRLRHLPPLTFLDYGFRLRDPRLRKGQK